MIYLQWRKPGGKLFKVEVTFYFAFSFCFFSRNLLKTNKMKDCLETTKSGQKGQTRGPPLSRETEVRKETKETVRRFLMTSDD